MCGRFTQVVEARALAALYGDAVAAPGVEWPPRWNGAPTQAFLVCRLDAAGRRVLSLQRWGLAPSWARDRSIGHRPINARSETVAAKPALRAAFRRRRCLAPANGWFEWRRPPAGKAPIRIRLAGGRPFGFAGLWEAWGEGESRRESLTVLTCPAGEALAAVHARQPAVVAPEGYGSWLAAETPAERVQAPHPGPFALRRVGARVSRPGNDVPEVVRPVTGEGAVMPTGTQDGRKRLSPDFDGYFAAVEEQASPALHGRPVAVLPYPEARTCVITANAAAKRHGVGTGTGGDEARRRCPGTALVGQRPALYVRVQSRIAHAVNAETPIDAVCSVDDLCCVLGARDAAEDVGRRIKARLREAVGPRGWPAEGGDGTFPVPRPRRRGWAAPAA